MAGRPSFSSKAMPSFRSQEWDTICSISTPPGMGAIGIVRMSGPRALGIARKVFVPARTGEAPRLSGYSIRYGTIRDPGTGEVVDEVLLTAMKAPRTYTREDVVEINCHSGPVVLRRVLEILIGLGARPAEAGEFTRRAFLNGRIDLTRAEAVMDLVAAKTEAALRMAARQLGGALYREVGLIRDLLVRLLADVEAAVDFSEEELDLPDPARIKAAVLELIREIDQLISTGRQGRILTEGLSTAIVGKANVGKSSLLNRLLMEERAIVTPYPGTTRDVVEGMVDLEGVPLRILDTAGIRDARDPVEEEGVRRSRRSLEQADLVMMVADISEEPGPEDRAIGRLLREREKETVLVLNKCDLVKDGGIKGRYSSIEREIRSKITVIVSAKYDIGIDRLKRRIAALFTEGRTGSGESAAVVNARQMEALKQGRSALTRVLHSLERGFSEEVLSLDLREAAQALGRITGEVTTGDVLDEIFGRFCIGK